jgi:hypothetical protein
MQFITIFCSHLGANGRDKLRDEVPLIEIKDVC